ncbi:unnamed protein product [Prunus brigantina]
MRSVNTPATPTTRATSTLGLATFSPAHTIISPFIRRDVPGLVWGLSTRRLLLRHVRPQHNHNITPHTTGRTRSRMRSVNTLATPTTRATSTRGLATFSPAHTIISPLIRRDVPGLVWGLSTRRLLLRHVRPHKHITLGLATFSPAHTQSQGSTYYKFRTIQRSKPSEPGKYAICDIRSEH